MSDQEIRPSFSVRYLALTTFVALLPALFGGGIGWLSNEYFRDRKVIEVASTSTGNLAPISPSVAEKLEIQYRINETEKEEIGGLFRYDVTLANPSAEGVENLRVFITPPKGIKLIGALPTVSTNPSSAADFVKLEVEPAGANGQAIRLGLLNTRQSVTLSFSGIAKDIGPNVVPLSVVVQKKDWSQKNVSATNSDPRILLARFFTTRIQEFRMYDILVVLILAPMLLYFSLLYLKLAATMADSVMFFFIKDTPRWRRARRRSLIARLSLFD